MRTYKKILALALSAAMSLTLLAGCGGHRRLRPRLLAELQARV